mgnify:CR=1 FL=1
MGADYYGHLTLGILVSRSDFFDVTGTKRMCQRGHLQEGNQRFCPQCGKEVQTRPVEEPTPQFLAFCQRQDWDPKGTWESWRETTNDLGLSPAEQVSCYDPDLESFIFGVRLDECSGEGGSSGDAPMFTLSNLKERQEKLQVTFDELGLGEQEAGVFLTMYVSV